jgi:hypothetical protein
VGVYSERLVTGGSETRVTGHATVLI